MKFAASKYTLTHFTRRRHFDLTTAVHLGEITISPTPSVRILGVQLDTRLRFNMHY